jgi:hypothetical protein
MVVGAYIMVTAFEGYDPKAPICVQTALTTGTQSIPSSCRFPVWPLVIAVLVLGGGMKLADKLNHPA